MRAQQEGNESQEIRQGEMEHGKPMPSASRTPSPLTWRPHCHHPCKLIFWDLSALELYFKLQSPEERDQNLLRWVTGTKSTIQKYSLGTDNKILFLTLEATCQSVLLLLMKTKSQCNLFSFSKKKKKVRYWAHFWCHFFLCLPLSHHMLMWICSRDQRHHASWAPGFKKMWITLQKYQKAAPECNATELTKHPWGLW